MCFQHESYEDEHTGDVVCKNCGLVLMLRIVNSGDIYNKNTIAVNVQNNNINHSSSATPSTAAAVSSSSTTPLAAATSSSAAATAAAVSYNNLDSQKLIKKIQILKLVCDTLNLNSHIYNLAEALFIKYKERRNAVNTQTNIILSASLALALDLTCTVLGFNLIANTIEYHTENRPALIKIERCKIQMLNYLKQYHISFLHSICLPNRVYIMNLFTAVWQTIEQATKGVCLGAYLCNRECICCAIAQQIWNGGLQMYPRSEWYRIIIDEHNHIVKYIKPKKWIKPLAAIVINNIMTRYITGFKSIGSIFNEIFLTSLTDVPNTSIAYWQRKADRIKRIEAKRKIFS